jgi:hypothetical protein
MDEPDFRAGRLSIRYLEHHPDLLRDGTAAWQRTAATVAAVLLEHGARTGDEASKTVHRGQAGPAADGTDGTAGDRRELSAWQRALDRS